MASNLASIGFHFDDTEEFAAVMLPLAETAIERLGCPVGDYAIWRSRTGAEIWFHLPLFGTENDARDIEGLTPFFEGESEVAVTITQAVARPGDNPFEGALACRIRGARGQADSAELAFEAVDFAVRCDMTAAFECHARLVGFAHGGRVLGEGEAASGISAVSAAPAVASATTMARSAPSLVRIAGRVCDCRQCVNEVSAKPFEWLLVDAGCAIVDVVTAPGVIGSDIAKGSTIEVNATLFGRIVD